MNIFNSANIWLSQLKIEITSRSNTFLGRGWLQEATVKVARRTNGTITEPQRGTDDHCRL